MKAMAALLLFAASPALAQPLTVKTGETWSFTVKNGQPVDAHRVVASAKPAKGQIVISVRALMGTTMVVTNNSPNSYSFRAELLQGGKTVAARPCTLPGRAHPIFEQWQQKADAVRVGNFVASGEEGRC